MAHTTRTHTEVATREQLDRVASALEGNNLTAQVVGTSDEARAAVLELLPRGGRILLGLSKTLDEIGLVDAVDGSNDYASVKKEWRALDRETQELEIRTLRTITPTVVGSVHAVTEAGHALIASQSGSQLGAYVFGAERVVWVIGGQKVVGTLEDGIRRIEEHAAPLEDERVKASGGAGTAINNILIVRGSKTPGRIKAILVEEHLGF